MIPSESAKTFRSLAGKEGRATHSAAGVARSVRRAEAADERARGKRQSRVPGPASAGRGLAPGRWRTLPAAAEGGRAPTAGHQSPAWADGAPQMEGAPQPADAASRTGAQSTAPGAVANTATTLHRVRGHEPGRGERFVRCVTV